MKDTDTSAKEKLKEILELARKIEQITSSSDIGQE